MLVTKPCGMMPGGSPGLTREQVSVRYRAWREGGKRGGDGIGWDGTRFIRELLASTLPAASPMVLLPAAEGRGGALEGKV